MSANSIESSVLKLLYSENFISTDKTITYTQSILKQIDSLQLIKIEELFGALG